MGGCGQQDGGIVLPSLGIGSLSAREAEGRANITTGDKEAHKLLQPVDNTLKTMALEFAEYQDGWKDSSPFGVRGQWWLRHRTWLVTSTTSLAYDGGVV